MYDLSESIETQGLLDTVGRIARGPLDQAARESDRTGEIPGDLERLLDEVGILTSVEEQFGGGGVPDPVSHVLAIESLAGGDPSIIGSLLLASVSSLFMGSQPSTKLIEMLGEIAGGSRQPPALALFEGYGRSPFQPEATCRQIEAGRWEIRGAKQWLALCREPTDAVVVGSDPETGGLVAAVVELKDPGVVREEVPSSGRYIAMNAARFGGVRINTVVDGDVVIGDHSGNLSSTVARTRALLAAVALGAGYRALEYAIDYAKERVAFGQPIARFQAVSFMLADDRMRLDSAHLGLLEAASLSQAGKGYNGHFVDRTDMRLSESYDAASSAVRNAIQVLGGHGFIDDHPVERWFRCVAVLSAIDFDPLLSSFASAL
jgi:alkylation response protein AidB-like acyl-CoA dehydrogenase